MKIINSKPIRVIFYYYYLFQGKDGRFAENLAIRMLAMFLTPIICGVLSILSALVYSSWIGIVLGIPVSIYIYLFILVRKMENTRLATKITKEKPKILNSNVLSIIFVILFTVFSFLFFFGCGYLAKEIDERGIHLIK